MIIALISAPFGPECQVLPVDKGWMKTGPEILKFNSRLRYFKILSGSISKFRTDGNRLFSGFALLHLWSLGSEEVEGALVEVKAVRRLLKLSQYLRKSLKPEGAN